MAAMTFGDFKKVVAGYMQRSAAVFAPSTVDLLGHAINAARKSAELKMNFELAKARGQLSVNLTTGAALSSMVYEGTATTLPVKALLKAFLPLVTSENTFFPIEIISRDKHVERVQRYYAGQITEIDGNQQITESLTTKYQLVRFGENVYLSPADSDSYNGSSSVTVKFDVIRWLSDYSADVDTDFLLEHCNSWMLFQTLWQLNLYLKEDQRVPVNERAMEVLWNDVVNWNSTLLHNSAEDANLD